MIGDHSRDRLHVELKKVCPNVYYVTGDRNNLKYPCIVYSRKSLDTERANNRLYIAYMDYAITYMTRDATNSVIEKMFDVFPQYCSFDNDYETDGIINEYFTVSWPL